MPSKGQWRNGVSIALLAVVSIGLQVFEPFEQEAPDCEMDGVRCERDGDAWLIEGKDFAGDVTLFVDSGAELVLRDVHVSRATAVNLQVECSCVVRGEDFTVDGVAGSGVQVWLNSDRDAPASDITLDGIQVTNLDRFGVADISGTVTLANMTFTCASSHHSLQLSALNSTKALLFRDVRSDGCNGWSFSSDGPSPFTVDLLRVHHQGMGNQDGYNDGIGSTAETSYALVITDSSISGTRYGIDLRDRDSLRMHNTTMKENLVAISGSDNVPVDVTASSFLRNGNRLIGECGGAIIGDLAGSVHGSVFSGNSRALGFGASGLPDFDATLNYWGAPTGPTVSAACAPTSPLGDPVVDIAPTIPFLTFPP